MTNPILSLPNGPHKKFYLMKTYGPALRAAGCTVDVRKLSCDAIVALLRQHGVI